MTQAKDRENLVKIRWSAAEDEMIRLAWPTDEPIAAIAANLPGRSLSSIRRRAFELGVSRPTHLPHPGKAASQVTERDGAEGKICTKCDDWKPLEKFSKHPTCAGGRRNVCTTCEGRRAYANNSERVVRNVLIYQERHPEKVRVHRLNGHAKRRERVGAHHGPHGVTVGDLRALREVYGDLCVYCGAPADTLDHVIPLARGGEHRIENLVPACASCNRSKSSKTPDEWRERITRKGA